MRPALSHPLAELLLGEVVRLHEQLVGARGLDGVQIGALEVLNERELEAVRDVLAHDRGDRCLSRGARREDTAVAGHQLVPVPLARYHYRLQDAVAADGGCELLDPFAVELRPWLLRVGRDLLERDLIRHRRGRDGGSSRRRPQEDIEAAAESGACHQADPGSAIGSRRRRRCSISRASSPYAFAAREEGSYTEIGLPWLGASASRTVRGIRVRATSFGKCLRTSSMTCIERRFRRSSIVRTIARTSSRSLSRRRTASIVSSSCARPSSA